MKLSEEESRRIFIFTNEKILRVDVAVFFEYRFEELTFFDFQMPL